MKHPDSFNSSIRILLILGQICGLLPLKGIFGANPLFTWTNPIHLYGLFLTGITMFFDICYTIDNFKTKFGLDVYRLDIGIVFFLRRLVAGSTVFYTVCVLTTLFFLQIAIQFPEVSKEFLLMEQRMADYGYPNHVGLKVKVFLYTFLILATAEHGALLSLNSLNAWHSASESGKGFFFLFYSIRFPPIESRVSFSGIRLFIFFWVNIMCTLNWNFLDFFIITMSLEISTRFAQINSKLTFVCLHNKHPNALIKIFKDYNRLSLLTKKIDKILGKIILTSFFSNMYHLSLQLVRSLNYGLPFDVYRLGGNLVERIYFYFSLSYLVVRLLLVLFFASKIHEESKKILETLFSLKNHSREAIRFLHQVLTDEIALTGNKYFVITRKFFMSVIGTIVTYQAFFLQINSLNQELK